MPNIRKDPDHNLEFYKKHREEYAKLIKKANTRWRNIEKHELSSPAVEEAIESRKGAHYFTMEYFKRDPVRELQALRTFLSDETSTVKGAQYYTDVIPRAKEFEAQFGKPWDYNTETGQRENNYANYFSDLYGEDFTKRIYSNYRKVEEQYFDLLAGNILKGTFDSETLIEIMFSRAVESKKKHFKEENWEKASEFSFAMKTMERYDRQLKDRADYFKNSDTQTITRILIEGGDYFDYVGELYI